MKRFTYFDGEKWCLKINDTVYSGFPFIDRLAAYEDTGLEQEEYKKHADSLKKLDIEHMHDLLLAEKDGRLVVLPVPVGAGKVAYGLTDEEAEAALKKREEDNEAD